MVVEPPKTERKVLTISEITRSLKFLLERSYPFVWLTGEISNLTKHRSGHWYFTLKDSGAQIRVVMFRGSNAKIKFDVESGMEVVVGGRITIYEQSGQYQMLADSMEPKGIGALQLAFEQLKEKLAKEGLFNEERKRPIPFLAGRVGIVTSPTGAVIQDIINVTGRRFPSLPLLLFPARVQGDGAASEIAEGIRQLNQVPDIEVLIVGRGGGSLEDLWPFNEEEVAREIYKSRVPVISAVGHETDWTIADFVADHRAPTPSAAAEMVAPVREELIRQISDLKNRLFQGSLQTIEQKRREWNRLNESYAFQRPEAIVEEMTQKVDNLLRELSNYGESALNEKRLQFQSVVGQLETLNPLGVLSRGYSLSTTPDGDLIRQIKDVSTGETMKTRVSDGELVSTVTEVRKND